MKNITFKRLLTMMLLGGFLLTAGCGAASPKESENTQQEVSAPDGEAKISLPAVTPLTDISLGEGLFYDSQKIGKEFLLTYDIDRLAVSLFRFSSNKDKAPVDMNKGYFGWENTGENGIGGHAYGHYMSACVNMYIQTGDEQFKDIVTRGVELLGIAQDEDGFVSGFSRNNLDFVFDNPDDFWAGGNNDAHLQGIWAPWYTIHKIMAGLIDAYEYIGIDEALVYAEKIAVYAKNGTDKLSDEQMEKMLIGEHGGINESFAKLYELTGKEEYIELAKRFSHKKVMDPLSRGENNLPGLHANTQIPKIIGAAKIYQLTGDEYYKKVSENFWKYTVETQLYVNGGTGDHEFFTKANEEPLSEKNCETCCVYNMLKLTEYIFSWDQDSKYADYYENALFNQILGSQNSEGRKTYSVDLSMGASTEFLTRENFECCLGTGMENPGRYTYMIYAEADGELYVNLFINSTLTLDNGMTVSQKTEYPYNGKSVLTVGTESPVNAAVNIRIPDWTKSYSVSVNGENASGDLNNGYLSLSRKWQDGDVIELFMPMELELYVSRESDSKVAFKYGGILLAGDLGSKPVRSIISDSRNPQDLIAKTGDGLTFELKGYDGGSIALKPFFEFESEPHMAYWYLYESDEDGSSNEELSSADKLSNVTIDKVVPGHMQSETDHNFRSEGYTSNGIHSPAAQDGANGSWRDVVGGYLSYDLAVDPESTNYLVSVFWGSDASGVYERVFDIYVNDVLVQKDYTLNNNKPDELEYLYIELPEEMTKGKTSVTVKYQADEGKQAGGIFGVRTVTEIPE